MSLLVRLHPNKESTTDTTNKKQTAFFKLIPLIYWTLMITFLQAVQYDAFISSPQNMDEESSRKSANAVMSPNFNNWILVSKENSAEYLRTKRCQ